MPEVIVENIVASTSFVEKLDLDAISQGLEKAKYEPEQFPGLVYRIDEPKVAMLLFGSGKIVCTGACRIEDVTKAIQKISDDLSSLDLIKR
jgi:transcription initiation factor TFIID TATA-box-binding protein